MHPRYQRRRILWAAFDQFQAIREAAQAAGNSRLAEDADWWADRVAWDLLALGLLPR